MFSTGIGTGRQPDRTFHYHVAGSAQLAAHLVADQLGQLVVVQLRGR